MNATILTLTDTTATVEITIFGETRTIAATIIHAGPFLSTRREFRARAGLGAKSYPVRIALWPVGPLAAGAALKIDLTDTVLRRQVVASGWLSQATEVTTRAGWQS